MRILFLTPYVPSKRAGGENFTRLLLDDLSKDNYIDLVYFKYKEDPEYESNSENIRVVKVLNNSIAVKIINCIQHFIHPVFSVRFDKKLLRFIRNQLSVYKYDYVYLDHSQMFLYAKYLKNVPIIMMSHDVMAQRYERSGNLLMKKIIVKSEGDLMRLPNTTVFTFSEKDKSIIKKLYGVESNVTHFFLDEMITKTCPQSIDKRLVFFGKWKRQDNFVGLKWFFDNVLPKVDESIAVSIIGGWLPDSFQKEYVDGERVTYLGFVDNPYQIISNSIAVLSPIFTGAGVKVKVVEALACGTPVIGNEIAFEGIGCEFNDFMFMAKTVDEYIQQIKMVANISQEERVSYKQSFLRKYSEDSITQFLINKQ